MDWKFIPAGALYHTREGWVKRAGGLAQSHSVLNPTGVNRRERREYREKHTNLSGLCVLCGEFQPSDGKPNSPAAAPRAAYLAFPGRLCYNPGRRRGEVSEWLMVPLSKSGRRKPRGFESHPLRQGLVRWSRGLVVRWSLGQVVTWSRGRLVTWSRGRLVTWSLGHVVALTTGLPDHLTTRPPDYLTI